MELERRLEQVERLLTGKGVDAWEIASGSSRDLTVEAKGGKVEAFKVAEPFGVALRVLSGEGLGFSFATTLDPAALDRMVEGALVAARMQSQDPCHLLPGPVAERYPELPWLDDPELPRVPEERKIAAALELERLTLARDSRLKRVRKSSYSESSYRFCLKNSHGVLASYSGSQVSASVLVIAEADGDAQSGGDFAFGNRFADLDLQAIAERAGAKAVSMLGARTMPTMRCPAVFDNRAAHQLLDALSASFLGENALKGKSALTGRVGEKIFSDLITVCDDGLLPGGTGSAPCDGEGVPQRQNVLVADGVLRGYLYDSYWGKKAGVPSTGNAVRNSMRTQPKSGMHNLVLKAGASSREELLAGIEKGVLITDLLGMHMANQISGDFSLGAAGFYVEKGAVVRPVKGIAVAGNLLDLFKTVDMVGDDLRIFGTVGSPSLRIAALDVSGS